MCHTARRHGIDQTYPFVMIPRGNIFLSLRRQQVVGKGTLTLSLVSVLICCIFYLYNACEGNIMAYGFTIKQGQAHDVRLNISKHRELPICKIPQDMLTEYENLTTRDMRHYIHQEEDSVIVEPDHFCEESDPIFLLFLIHSAPGNTDQREAIRKTWKRNLLAIRPDIRLVFSLGVPNDLSHQDHIVEEAKVHKDIVQMEFCDSYFNMTLKQVYGLQWILWRCPQAKYVFKGDDDNFVHPLNLLHFLLNLKEADLHQLPEASCQYANMTYLMAGFAFYDLAVIRDTDSKWFVPETAYPGEVYPPYFTGAAFLFTGELIPLLYRESLEAPFIHIDDAFLVGIVASQNLGLEINDHTGFHTEYTCNPNNFIVVNDVGPETLLQMWGDTDDVMRTEFNILCESSSESSNDTTAVESTIT